MDPLNGMFGQYDIKINRFEKDQRATGIQGLFLDRVSVAERNQKTWLQDDLSDLQGQRATEATHSPEAVNNWARQGPEMGIMS